MHVSSVGLDNTDDDVILPWAEGQVLVAAEAASAAAYAIAVAMSATRDIGWRYADARRLLQERVLRTDLLLPQGWSDAHGHFFLISRAHHHPAMPPATR